MSGRLSKSRAPRSSHSVERETILIVGEDRKQVERLHQEMRSSGHQIICAVRSGAVDALLSSPNVGLIILIEFAGEKSPEQGPRHQTESRTDSSAFNTLAESAEELEIRQLCQALKTETQAPVLLISTLWAETVFEHALATGADSFLFAPYQPTDLLQIVRDTLLNGSAAESDSADETVEVIHHDRTHRVTAGRSRLVRVGFSLLEELRQCRAALSWSRAEVQDLRRQLRQTRQSEQQNARFPVVLQGFAHDFSNLLLTIGAAASMLRANPAEPKSYRHALDVALSQAGSLLTALRKTTDSAVENEDEFVDAVDLNQLAQEVIDASLLEVRAPKIRVRVQLEGVPPVAASRPLMIRILSNLIWNAVEAMPDGGRLSLLGYQRKHRVVMEVTDSGVGMSRSAQEKVLHSAHSTEQGHAGMGLLLVQELVSRAGGEIAFASKPGKGTTFVLSFPAADANGEATEISHRRKLLLAAP